MVVTRLTSLAECPTPVATHLGDTREAAVPGTYFLPVVVGHAPLETPMIGEILSTIGLIVSAGGLVGTVRAEKTAKSLAARMQEAQAALEKITDDTDFICAALDSLSEIEGRLGSSAARAVLEVRHVADETLLHQVVESPSKFGVTIHRDINDAMETSGLFNAPSGREHDEVPLLIVQATGEPLALSISRKRLLKDDVLGTTPLKTFDPETVGRLAHFLSNVEMSMESGDKFECQFEED